jgi:hypothetical protein
MVEDPIQDRRRNDSIAEDLSRAAEALIAREDHGPAAHSGG